MTPLLPLVKPLVLIFDLPNSHKTIRIACNTTTLLLNWYAPCTDLKGSVKNKNTAENSTEEEIE
jgi:hypothetical protein